MRELEGQTRDRQRREPLRRLAIERASARAGKQVVL
jgi:hypothetical protein